MAVNVDSVYQTVQALANKEQRGYLTPQEFNLFATYAQKDIFESYLYDLDAVRKAEPSNRELADSLEMILFKINQTDNVNISIANPTWTAGTGMVLPNNVITCKITYNQTSINKKRTLTRVDNIDEIYDARASKWHKEGFDDFVYHEDTFKRIRVWTGTGEVTDPTKIEVEVISGEPGLVYWNYIVVNGKPVYNPGSSKNFDLHSSEYTELVAKITKLAGISIEDPQLYQAGQTEVALDTQKEKK